MRVCNSRIVLLYCPVITSSWFIVSPIEVLLLSRRGASPTLAPHRLPEPSETRSVPAKATQYRPAYEPPTAQPYGLLSPRSQHNARCARMAASRLGQTQLVEAVLQA